MSSHQRRRPETSSENEYDTTRRYSRYDIEPSQRVSSLSDEALSTPQLGMPLRLPQRLAGRIWVTCTSLLIAFIAYPSQGMHHILGMAVNFQSTFCFSDRSSKPLIVRPKHIPYVYYYSILVGLLYWNYHLCVRTDPGGVPDGWVSFGAVASEYALTSWAPGT